MLDEKKWTHALERLEVLYGIRGEQNDHAVRWKDIADFAASAGTVLVKNKSFTKALNVEVSTEAIDQLTQTVTTNKQDAEAAIDALQVSLTNTANSLQVDYAAAQQAAQNADDSAQVAITKAGEASASAGAAASSESDAAQHVVSAASQATLAAQSSSDAAGFSATAENSKNDAVVAKNTAEGAAAAAAASATLSAQIQTELELIGLTTFEEAFERDAEYWIEGYQQSKAQLATSDTVVEAFPDVTIVEVIGEGNVLQADGVYRLMSERAQRPFVDDQKIRLTMRTRLTQDPAPSDGAHKHSVYLTGIDETGAHTDFVYVGQFIGRTVLDGWDDVTIDFDPSAFREAAAQGSHPFAASASWRLMIGLNGWDLTVGGAIQQVSFVLVEDITGSNALSAEINTLQVVQAQHGGRFSAMYVLGVEAGNESAGLQVVVGDDPTAGPTSVVRISARDIITEGTLWGDDIRFGKMNGRYLEVTELLEINSQTGAFSMGKLSAADYTNDGIFMGRALDSAGGLGFALLAGRTVGGVPQYLSVTPDEGVVLSNVNYMISGGDFTDVVRTTSSTVTLPASTKVVNLQIIGGGAGGERTVHGGAPTSGGAGGATTVELFDGATSTGQSWSASGGLPNGTPAEQGGDKGIGGRGAGGDGSNAVYFYGDDPSNDNTSRAAGRPGRAGQARTFGFIDVSGLTDPKLKITIGGGGSGPGDADAGIGGEVTYGYSDKNQQRALVKAEAASATGTFSTTAATARDFPDLGAGFWQISVLPANLTFTFIEIDVDDDTPNFPIYNVGYACFYSTKTPRIINPQFARTIDYKFWSVG